MSGLLDQNSSRGTCSTPDLEALNSTLNSQRDEAMPSPNSTIIQQFNDIVVSSHETAVIDSMPNGASTPLRRAASESNLVAYGTINGLPWPPAANNNGSLPSVQLQQPSSGPTSSSIPMATGNQGESNSGSQSLDQQQPLNNGTLPLGGNQHPSTSTNPNNQPVPPVSSYPGTLPVGVINQPPTPLSTNGKTTVPPFVFSAPNHHNSQPVAAHPGHNIFGNIPTFIQPIVGSSSSVTLTSSTTTQPSCGLPPVSNACPSSIPMQPWSNAAGQRPSRPSRGQYSNRRPNRRRGNIRHVSGQPLCLLHNNPAPCQQCRNGARAHPYPASSTTRPSPVQSWRRPH